VIVCTVCGHRNDADAEFCASCGEFLEWKGERVAETSATISAGAATDEVETATAETTPAIKESTPLPADGDGAGGPGAVPPGDEAVRRPPKPPPVSTEELEPGQLICDQCAAPNRAEARFCRRCGASLIDATAVERPSWWRRLLHRRRRTYSAGERRSRRRVASGGRATVGAVRTTMSRVMRSLAILSMLGIGVGGVLAWRAGLGDATRDAYGSVRIRLFPRYEPAVPVRWRASSHVGSHTARKAFDKNLTTFWAEGGPGNGKNQKLVAHFDRPVDLARVGITLGDQRKPERFLDRPVPHRLRIRYFGPNGRFIAGKVLFLAQKPDFQRFSLDGNNVTRVVATILVSYPGQSKNHDAAIAEIEYFEKT
jgi:ribosomal protein L40E